MTGDIIWWEAQFGEGWELVCGRGKVGDILVTMGALGNGGLQGPGSRGCGEPLLGWEHLCKFPEGTYLKLQRWGGRLIKFKGLLLQGCGRKFFF